MRHLGAHITAGATLALGLAVACGGGSDQNSTGTGSSGNTNSVTITLTSSGPSPQGAQVDASGRVTFANTDSAAHTIRSTDCAFLNVGPIAAGATMVVSVPAQTQTCHYQMAEGGSQGTLAVVSFTADGGTADGGR